MDRKPVLERIYSTRGQEIGVVRFMPLVRDEMLETSIYLYASVADAEQGRKTGGSGFLVAVDAERNPGKFFYAVTNRHVVESGGTVIRINTQDDHFDIADLDDRHWAFHPDGDDLAITLIGLTAIHKFRHVQFELLLEKAAFPRTHIALGEEVFVVGRFINHEGAQKNIPTVRFGNIAQMPGEPIRQERGKSYFDQESFLVDAKSIGGYSGSPVFVEIDGNRSTDGNRRENRIWLLGIDWGHIKDWHPVYDEAGRPLTTLKIKHNTGMMGVVPSWKLREMLMSPSFKETREILENEALANAKPTVGETDALVKAEAKAEPAIDNPSHKEDFTRLLGAAARSNKPAS